MSQLQGAALVALGLIGGLLIGGLFGAYGLHRAGANVEFTGNVSIPGAVSLRFYHNDHNVTIDTVLPLNGTNQIKVFLINSASYTITAYASNHNTICTSALYVPSGVASFTATIICG